MGRCCPHLCATAAALSNNRMDLQGHTARLGWSIAPPPPPQRDRTETQRGRLWTACGQRRVDSKNSQTNPATTSTSSIRQLLGAADAQTAHHATSSTAPAHQLLGSANAETTPARAPAAAADRKQRPDATCEQHAKGRTGDCPGPRKEITTGQNVTQGGILLSNCERRRAPVPALDGPLGFLRRRTQGSASPPPPPAAAAGSFAGEVAGQSSRTGPTHGNRTGQTALAENGAECRRTRKGKTGKNHCGCQEN